MTFTCQNDWYYIILSNVVLIFFFSFQPFLLTRDYVRLIWIVAHSFRMFKDWSVGSTQLFVHVGDCGSINPELFGIVLCRQYDARILMWLLKKQFNIYAVDLCSFIKHSALQHQHNRYEWMQGWPTCSSVPGFMRLLHSCWISNAHLTHI